jgi:hypothetical protein
MKFKISISIFIGCLLSFLLPFQVKAVNKPGLFINPPDPSTKETEIGITNIDRLEICKVELTVNFPKNLLTIANAPGYIVTTSSNDRGELKYTANLETCMADRDFHHFPSIIFSFTQYGEQYVYFSSAKAYDRNNRPIDITYNAAIIGPYDVSFGSNFRSTTYTPPVSQAPTTSTPNITPKTTNKTASAKPTSTITQKPNLALTTRTKLSINNKTIDLSSSNITPILTTKNRLILSGSTSPNAKITLTIHSNPIAQEVTANNKGEWTYTLDPQILKLPIGEHTITAIATNSQGIKSDEQTLTSFTLKRELKPIPRIVEDRPIPYVNRMTILLFLLFIASTLTGVIFIKRNRINKKLPTT